MCSSKCLSADNRIINKSGIYMIPLFLYFIPSPKKISSPKKNEKIADS